MCVTLNTLQSWRLHGTEILCFNHVHLQKYCLSQNTHTCLDKEKTTHYSTSISGTINAVDLYHIIILYKVVLDSSVSEYIEQTS